jgi:hypothetical protein
VLAVESALSRIFRPHCPAFLKVFVMDSSTHLGTFKRDAETSSREIYQALRPYAAKDDDLLATVELISVELGVLNARVRYLETAQSNAFSGSRKNTREKLFKGSDKIPAERLADEIPNHGIESTAAGLQFTWTSSSLFDVPVRINRNRKRYLRMWLHALILPEYLKSMRLYIDGKRVKARSIPCSDSYVIEVQLPPSEDIGTTILTVALPSVHSPNELGISGDSRQLGLAILGLDFAAWRIGWLRSRYAAANFLNA